MLFLSKTKWRENSETLQKMSIGTENVTRNMILSGMLMMK